MSKMTIIKNLINLIFVVILIWLLTSCSQGFLFWRSSTQDPRQEWIKRWLNHSDPSCQPPCYENIIPGTTSVTNAETILKNNPNIKNVSRSFAHLDSKEQKIEWSYDPKSHNEILLTDNNGEIVETIALGFSSEQSIFLAEVIGSYGDPTDISVGSCLEGPCDVSIIYLSRGMEFRTQLISPKIDNLGYSHVMIDANTEISSVWYFEPGIEGIIRSLGENYDSINRYIHWKGYGYYPEISK